MRRQQQIAIALALLSASTDEISGFSLNALLRPFIRNGEGKTLVEPQPEIRELWIDETETDVSLAGGKIDTKLNPLLNDEGSVESVLETLDEVHGGSLAAAEAITKAISEAAVPSIVSSFENVTTEFTTNSSAVTGEEDTSKEVKNEKRIGFGINRLKAMVMMPRKKSEEKEAKDVAANITELEVETDFIEDAKKSTEPEGLSESKFSKPESVATETKAKEVVSPATVVSQTENTISESTFPSIDSSFGNITTKLSTNSTIVAAEEDVAKEVTNLKKEKPDGFGFNGLKAMVMKPRKKLEEKEVEDVAPSISALEVDTEILEDIQSRDEHEEVVDETIAKKESANTKTKAKRDEIQVHSSAEFVAQETVGSQAEITASQTNEDTPASVAHSSTEPMTSDVDVPKQELIPGTLNEDELLPDNPATSLEKREPKYMIESAIRMKKRLAALPLFQYQSASVFLKTELAPPEGLDEILPENNSTTPYLALQCAQAATLSAVEFVTAITLFGKALLRTIVLGTEIREVFGFLGGRIQTTAQQCRDCCKQSDRRPSSLATKTKKMTISIVSLLPFFIITLLESMVCVISAPEAVSGADRLRESLREASASVVFGITTIIRCLYLFVRKLRERIPIMAQRATALGQGIISKAPSMMQWTISLGQDLVNRMQVLIGKHLKPNKEAI